MPPPGPMSALPPAEAGLGPVPAVRLREVSRIYRRPRTSLLRPGAVVEAVRSVTLDIERGQRFGIVGESGCGKSTLLRILAGLDRPTSGTVEVEGVEISRLPERRLGFLRAQLQLVFQDPMGSLDPRMRVRDIIAEPLVAQGYRDNGARVSELLDAVGLAPEAADRFPHQFSGGQRQRISIARALAPNPRILVADEPVSALDVSVRAQVLNLIDDIVDRLSLTLIFVSHDLSVVRHVCDVVAVMGRGRVVEVGPTSQVYDTPAHSYTRQLVAAAPRLQAALAGRTAAVLAADTLAARPTPAPTAGPPGSRPPVPIAPPVGPPPAAGAPSVGPSAGPQDAPPGDDLPPAQPTPKDSP